MLSALKYLFLKIKYFDAMKSYAEIAQVLRNSAKTRKVTQAALRDRSGVSQRTVTKVLGGHDDFKVSTLLAMADRLGLELLLVPKEAARAVAGGSQATSPIVKTRVQAALDRIPAPKKRDKTP